MSKIYLILFVSIAILGFALPASACNYHAYKDCQGSAIYWYDSCANRQDLFQDCAVFGQTCQYGQCVIKQITPITPVYIAHYKIACFSNNLYWFDTLGASSGLYKNCGDGATCKSGTCIQPVAPVTPVTPVVQVTLTPAFLGKNDVVGQQWSKTIEVGQNSTVYFLLNVINNSNVQAENVVVSVSIPSDIFSLGNLKVNDAVVVGDIVSGIGLGTMPANSSKAITFEGRTQSIDQANSKQATVNIKADGASQSSDNFTINFTTNQAQAAVSQADVSYPLADFLKRWYLWILAGIVLVFLFVVVYRRVSST